MHDFAEREEHDEQVREKYMQNQHKGMATGGDGHRQIRFQIKQTHKVASVVLYGELGIVIPSPGPVHLSAEHHGEKQQHQQVVIFRDGEITDRRNKPSEEEIDQGNDQNQAHQAPSEKDFVLDQLEDSEPGEELQMAHNQEQYANVKQHEKDP
jgi:hypothetical protein